MFESRSCDLTKLCIRRSDRNRLVLSAAAEPVQDAGETVFGREGNASRCSS